MKSLTRYTIKDYLEVLSKKEPTPGGGSVAALTGALGVSLISMVTRYSKGKGKGKGVENQMSKILLKSEQLRRRLLELVELDTKAYQEIVRSKGKSAKIRQRAKKKALSVPREICRLCYKAVNLTPTLVKKGNQNLLSDLEVAIELILVSHYSSMVLIKENER